MNKCVSVSDLDYHVIDAVDIELDFGSGVGVTEAELCFGLRSGRQSTHEIGKVKADTTQNLLHLREIK